MSHWPYSNYSKTSPEAEKYFPFAHPREHQLETISEIKQAIDKGYRYIVLEAGTGTGKSAIAATLAQMFDSSYILTVTKQLQDQYLNDFGNLDFRLVKGRSNFRCRKYGNGTTCDIGKCIVEGEKCKFSLKGHSGKEITEENTCEYYYQKYLGLLSQTTIANYPYMFLELNYVEDFTKRDLMICDEAHNIENVIMSQLTLEFERKDLKEYVRINLSKDLINQLTTGDHTDWVNFVTKVKAAYEKELSKIDNIEKPELAEKKIFMKNMIGDCRRFLDNLLSSPEMWIFDWDKKSGIAQFKPIRVDSYAENTLFKYADVCLFMSATILNYRLFAHWLGIRQDEIYAIRRKSPFDIKRNPIKTYKNFNMSRIHLEKSAPDTIDTIKEILENHKTDKGIIHTISGKCRDFLIENIGNERLIFHDTQNRADIIEEFKASADPLVLVSPSVGEGVDLPGDECRFQIIYKMPYLDLADKQISMRAALDSRWYDYKTALNLVQTHGRGMRFEDDHCRTYFIDSRLRGFISQDAHSNRFIPDTFKDAIENFSVENIKEQIIDENGQNFKRKMELIEKANSLSKENVTEAIRFCKELITDDLFKNDCYPYIKLAEAYHELSMFEKETEIIVKFFKSGTYADENALDDFKMRLKALDEKGYFDYDSQIMDLENEFYIACARNQPLQF